MIPSRYLDTIDAMTNYTEDEVHRTCEIQRWVDKRRQADDAIEGEITAARNENMSWARIGAALGTSGQAAWQRYGLSPEEKRQLALAQERRFQQLELDMDSVDRVPAPSEQHGRKDRRGKADR